MWFWLPKRDKKPRELTEEEIQRFIAMMRRYEKKELYRAISRENPELELLTP